MPTADPAPAFVLDASALMAHLADEDGAPRVREAMEAGAAISVVNLAEVLSKAAEVGDDPEKRAGDLRGALTVEPLTELDCVAVALLRPVTRALGFSLADRACLVLAERLGVPALSADRDWQKADVSAEVELIR